ncbi:MAG TPA: hypothetical protein PLS67_13865 [Accumulibacter sp.]|jgi:hypothetical protein|nr:hypothetical protein [Accumulibacter sp.]HQC81575.1 hypothetical protein [Accumulibacter sp.]
MTVFPCEFLACIKPKQQLMSDNAGLATFSVIARRVKAGGVGKGIDEAR